MHCFDGLTCVTVLCNEGWTTGVIGESPVILHTTENVRCFQKMFIFANLFSSHMQESFACLFTVLIFILPTIPCLFRFLSRRFSKDFAIFACFFSAESRLYCSLSIFMRRSTGVISWIASFGKAQSPLVITQMLRIFQMNKVQLNNLYSHYLYNRMWVLQLSMVLIGLRRHSLTEQDQSVPNTSWDDPPAWSLE